MTIGVESIQNLIEDFLENNQERVIINQKKLYRTYKITGEQLKEKIAKTQTFLKNKKIKKTDKIIIQAQNSIEWISLYFACIFSGITVVPLDLSNDKILLEKIKRETEAKAVFHNEDLEKLDKALEKIKNSKIRKEQIKGDDILQIIYTSGTTSDPKGVVLTYENITEGVNYTKELVPIPIKLKFLNLLPLSHIFSQIGLFFLMYCNHEIFLIDTIQPNKIIHFIKNKRINGVILVPGIMEALKKDLERKSITYKLGAQFRIIGVGGASLDPELEKWWKRHLIQVIQGYGLTETSSIISSNKFGATRTGSVGKISKHIELKLSKDKEILVKGKNIFSGYYKDQHKTKGAFLELGKWFRTGDIGEIKNNYLYIRGRKKDIIITGSGLNVYPSDIEQVLNKMPEVEESCVIEKDGKIHAVLILNKKINPKIIIQRANSHLLSHQKIQDYSIWGKEEFPKTPVGKIKKYLVSEEIGKEKEKIFSYEDKLYRSINKILKPRKKITEKSKLIDLGMDSLRRVELISELEREFQVEIDEIKLDPHAKVSNLKEIMSDKKNQRYSLQNLAYESNIKRN